MNIKRRTSPYFPFLIVSAWLFAGQAQAVQTDWAYSEGGRMRVSALREAETGSITALLEIEPKAGWKTYWKNPGDAGVPPQFDTSASENLLLSGVHFPVPEIGRDEGGRFIGYHHPVGLLYNFRSPSTFQPAKLRVSVMIGLCKDICLPFQSQFSLDVGPEDTVPVGDEFLKIALARTALPESPSDGFRVVRAVYSLKAGGLELKIKAPSKDLPQIAADPVAPTRLGPPTVRDDPDGFFYVRIPVRQNDGLRAEADVLIKSGDRAIQTHIDAGLEKTSTDGKQSP